MQHIIESVLHPTDFSEGSKIAFYHALKAALTAKSRITLLNVSDEGRPRWDKFPGVRETLERWNLLPEGSPKSAVGELGIDVRKMVTPKGDPVEAVVGYLKQHPAELIVIATHQRTGAMRWLNSSVAEPIARKANEMTLFISGDAKGFVSPDDGSVSLRNIIIPIAQTPEAQPALEAAARVVRNFNCEAGTFTLVHVGDSETMPSVTRPEVPGWEWKQEVRQGDVIQTIVDVSNENDADLIVMTTDGRNGFLDGLRGSHSERVLRLAGMPLLTVPLGSFVYDMV
ncbi:MAG TPA: universal stress protein [Pyrinomonadaceae bacterium]|nr:universal stress protein [Pyrinomonadaceae bacterium]